MSSSTHINNTKNYILILGKGTMQGLHGATSTEEVEYSINFTGQEKKN